LDKLLICALIEARSCERFKTFSEYLADKYLSDFYRKFMESEAGHYTLFMDLARLYFNHQEVADRWQYFLKEEAAIMLSLDVRGDRVH
jgi:tRNA-(ms[2]io[6]A)-hydroxylase